MAHSGKPTCEADDCEEPVEVAVRQLSTGAHRRMCASHGVGFFAVVVYDSVAGFTDPKCSFCEDKPVAMIVPDPSTGEQGQAVCPHHLAHFSLHAKDHEAGHHEPPDAPDHLRR